VEARAEYQARRGARAAEAERLGRRERAWVAARAVATVAGAAVLYLVADGKLPGWAVPLAVVLWLGTFAALARIDRLASRAQRATAFYERGLRRLDGRWPGEGPTGVELAAADHPYALDLDVLGEGSLFQLLCSARTRPGREALARWLLAPAGGDEVRRRQEAVRELAPELDLREAVALASADRAAELDAGAVASWGESPPMLPVRWLRPALLLLAAFNAAAAAAWLVLGWSALPFAAGVLAALGALALLRPRIAAVNGRVESPLGRLALVAELAALVEARELRSPRLAALREALLHDGPASRRIARLARHVERLQAMRNELLMPFAYAVAWPAQMACAIEAWRLRHGPRVRTWLAALAELEALSALAAHAFEHPADAFPEVIDGPGGPVFEAEGLGHPLLPEEACVRNDLTLGGRGPHLLLLSGSNMSGKSTLLRSVGTAVALGLAGGPVRARRLRLTPVALGASLRSQDSLLGGTSRFYAEIRRLRALTDLAARPVPLLFLLDEVLAGTNSHDRRQGAESVLRGLLARGAVGICTTHDLALAAIADGLGEAGANAHFGDLLEGSELRFDYRLRPGVVRHSNALALMRAVGLDV